MASETATEDERLADIQQHTADVVSPQPQEPRQAAPSSDKKLEELLSRLPPDVQGEIMRMIRRDPRISRCLAESEGREKEIIHAVRAGHVAGSAPVQAYPEERVTRITAAKRLKNIIQNMFIVITHKPKMPSPFIDPHNLPGVHPDFAPLAWGAYHNAMIALGHDGEHHELIVHEEHHEVHHEEVKEPAKAEEEPGYYHTGHAAAVVAGHQNKGPHGH